MTAKGDDLTDYKLLSGTNVRAVKAGTNATLSLDAVNDVVTVGVVGNPTFSGTLNATTLQEGGTSLSTLYQPKLWVAAQVSVSSQVPTILAGSQTGRATLTGCSRTGVGTYQLTWDTATGTNNYTVYGLVRNAPGFVSFNGTVNTQCNFITYNASGTATDNLPFNVFIYR